MFGSDFQPTKVISTRTARAHLAGCRIIRTPDMLSLAKGVRIILQPACPPTLVPASTLPISHSQLKRSFFVAPTDKNSATEATRINLLANNFGMSWKATLPPKMVS